MIDNIMDALRSIDEHGTLEDIPQWLINSLVVRGDVYWNGVDWMLSESALYRLTTHKG
jgi:hypothetical protein